MSRKPANVTATEAHLTPRDAIWVAIRKQKNRFTVGTIETSTRVNRETIKTYLQGLRAAEFIDVIDHEEHNGRYAMKNQINSFVFSLTRDVGVDAPRVTKAGKIVTQGAKRQKIWTAIRVLRGFSYSEVVMTASTGGDSVSEDEVRKYVQSLVRAKYVKKCGPSRPARFILLPVRNTGPKPLMIQRGGNVFDPNKNAVVWTREGGAQ